MPRAINELAANVDAQIHELKRLISSSNDHDRRAALEEQLQDLELERLDEPSPALLPSKRASFRPTLNQSRHMPLTPLTEDSPVISTSLDGLEVHRLDATRPSFVSDVFSSSYDAAFPPVNVLTPSCRTYWLSTGLFPHFLYLLLHEPKPIQTIEITCRHVMTLSLRVASSRTIQRLTLLETRHVSSAESERLSTQRFHLDARAIETIQIDIQSGDRNFVAIYVVRLHLTDEETDTDA